MSCDEEQVCLMIKQVQVKAISDGGYGPFSNTLSLSPSISLSDSLSSLVLNQLFHAALLCLLSPTSHWWQIQGKMF